MNMNWKSRGWLLVLQNLLLGRLVHSLSPKAFWAGYSTCAVNNCLVPITTNLPCETNDNSCVCTNDSFVSQIAACLGQECPNDVVSVYNAFSSNCGTNGGYTIALGQREFLVAANALNSYLQSQFWKTYPDCANAPCLTPLTAASGCEISTNECVCENTTLLNQMAECIGQSCASNVASNLYSYYSNGCMTNGGYSIALSIESWQSDAGVDPDSTSEPTSPSEATKTSPTGANVTPASSALSVSSLITSTTTNPSVTSSESTKGGGGLNLDQKIALGVGIPAAVLAIPGAIAAFLVCCKKTKTVKIESQMVKVFF